MPQAVYLESKGLPGGKIKRRYEDFIVEEVRADGSLCAIYSSDPVAVQEELNIPEKSGTHLYLNLTKTNHDLHFALKKIARFLRMGASRIGYAGIKDKRAITCQRVSIFEPDIARLKQFNSWGIKLSLPEWGNEPVTIGNLKGNKFTVRVRNIQLDETETRERINASFREMMEKGVANYFGQQRFGGIRNISHLVGLELLRGNIESAVSLYLSHYSEREHEEVGKARLLAGEKKYAEALEMFPKNYFYERNMLAHLLKYPNDFAGAFATIPRKVRYLFTHAYQSYFFNELLDARISSGIGLKAMGGEPSEDGMPLVMLPGYDSKFSEGKTGEIEKEILEKSGISLESFKMKTLAECSTKGEMRKALFFPENPGLKSVEKGEKGTNAVVEFTLPKGCYATQLLGIGGLIKDENMETADA